MKISSLPSLTANLREAVTIHLCAVAVGGLFVLLETAAYQSPEIVALRGLAFAAGTALFLWSIYLTARSCQLCEPLRPIVIFLIIILLELMIFSCWLLNQQPSYSPSTLFEYADYYGCAFYAVFFITLTFLAAPLAWHCARLERPAFESPDDYVLINRAIEIHALFMLLLTVVLLPPALFLYCVSTVEPERSRTWRLAYLEHCPDFVRDHTADMLALLNSNSNKSLHRLILTNGWASAEHLESQLTEEPLLESAALNGLLHKRKEAALPAAMGVAANTHYTGARYAKLSAAVVLNYAGDAQVRALLDPQTPVALHFREALIGEVGARRIEEYAGDLKRLISESASQDAALIALPALLTKNEFEALWQKYLCDSDELVRRGAVRVLHLLHPNPVKMIIECVNRTDSDFAALLLKNFRETNPYRFHDYSLNKEWVEQMKILSRSPNENLQIQANEWLRGRNSRSY